MSPILRRVIYVVSYGIIAMVFVTVALVVLGFGGGSSGFIAVVSSGVAIVWNFIWNTLFEAWERRQTSTKRTRARRVFHSVGFEGLLVFFLVYTFIFAWVFDLVLPPRTRATDSSEPH